MGCVDNPDLIYLHTKWKLILFDTKNFERKCIHLISYVVTYGNPSAAYITKQNSLQLTLLCNFHQPQKNVNDFYVNPLMNFLITYKSINLTLVYLQYCAKLHNESRNCKYIYFSLIYHPCNVYGKVRSISVVSETTWELN